jgi:hypothetical protein
LCAGFGSAGLVETLGRRETVVAIAANVGSANDEDEVRQTSADESSGDSQRLFVMGMEGVAAMVRAGVWLELRGGLEVLNIGRAGLDRKDSCTLELSGRHLFYTVFLDGGWVFLSAQPMDGVDSPERLIGVGDGPSGWQDICHLIIALERSAIKSLTPRPLQLGTPGSADCFVIG